MRGVAGQYDAALLILVRLAAGGRESGEPTRLGHRHVAARRPSNALAQFVERHRSLPIEVSRQRLRRNHAKVPAIQRWKWRTAAVPCECVGWGRGKLHIAESQQPCRACSRKSDPGEFAYRTASAVTSHDVRRLDHLLADCCANAQRAMVGALFEADKLMPAKQLDLEFDGPFDEQTLRDCLGHEDELGRLALEPTDINRDAAEVKQACGLAGVDWLMLLKARGEATMVEQVDRSS